MADTQELHDLAVTVARQAAAMVLERHGEVHAADTKASDLDLVTEIDRASEVLITDLLLAARPDDGIVGEEGADVASKSGVEWLVDPIDGTTSFFYGLPGFSVSIAARLNGTMVAGSVVAPAITTEYSALAGQGAWMNGDRITCRDTDQLGQALVGTGFGPDHARRARQGTAFATIIPQIRLLIAQEAGAVTVLEHDDASDRAFVFAAAPGIANELLTLVRSTGADQV